MNGPFASRLWGVTCGCGDDGTRTHDPCLQSQIEEDSTRERLKSPESVSTQRALKQGRAGALHIHGCLPKTCFVLPSVVGESLTLPD